MLSTTPYTIDLHRLTAITPNLQLSFCFHHLSSQQQEFDNFPSLIYPKHDSDVVFHVSDLDLFVSSLGKRKSDMF